MTQMDSSRPPAPQDDFYRILCEYAAVAMVATDADLKIVCWNDSASELLNSSADRMLGKSLHEVVPEERRRLLGRLVRRTMDRGETSQLELHLDDRAGRKRNLTVILSPVPGQAGRPQGIAAWLIDETHRKRLSERLAQAEKMASLGTLAGGVAHHFNNILGGVATFVDYALKRGDSVSMKRALQMTAEAAARASKITESLLSFAERDTGRRDLADLTEAVLTFAHLVEKPLQDRHIELRLDLDPVPVVPVEAARMQQVLGNLLSNAQDAMENGGTLSLGIRQVGDEAHLTFADSGEGIKPEQLPLIFEPFFTTKGLLAGGDQANPGLGLSVVHGIVVEMGGRIDVESEAGKGTKFTIALPIDEARRADSDDADGD